MKRTQATTVFLLLLLLWGQAVSAFATASVVIPAASNGAQPMLMSAMDSVFECDGCDAGALECGDGCVMQSAGGSQVYSAAVLPSAALPELAVQTLLPADAGVANTLYTPSSIYHPPRR